MFESIRGILLEKEPTKAIVEANGIGYRLSIGLNTYTDLPQINDPVLLYLSQVVREDAHTLYAFTHKENRDLFEMIITVSGIGPKTGLALIGHMDTMTFHQAIIAADTRIISKVPGIGKKTAERLIIEMRDKMKSFQKKMNSSPLIASSGDSFISDAVHALINLGYQPLHAQKAVQAARKENQDEKDLGSLITLALKKI